MRNQIITIANTKNQKRNAQVHTKMRLYLYINTYAMTKTKNYLTTLTKIDHLVLTHSTTAKIVNVFAFLLYYIWTKKILTQKKQTFFF